MRNFIGYVPARHAMVQFGCFGIFVATLVHGLTLAQTLSVGIAGGVATYLVLHQVVNRLLD